MFILIFRKNPVINSVCKLADPDQMPQNVLSGPALFAEVPKLGARHEWVKIFPNII